MPDAFEEEREHLQRLLQAIPVMLSHDGRESVLDEMRRARRFDLNVAATPISALHCNRILDAAMDRPGGLQRLANVVWRLDRSDPSRFFWHHVLQRHQNEFLSVVERNTLIQELSAQVLRDELIGYYRLATDELTDQPLEDLSALLLQVEQLPWHGVGHPLIRLTEAIAQRARTNNAAEAARTWSTLLAERIDALSESEGTERENLDRLRSSRAMLSAAALERPTLLLQLDPAIHRPERYRFTAWLYLGRALIEKIEESEDGDPLALPRIRERMGRVITKALTIADRVYQNTTEMDLEFILPRKLLCAEIDQWTNLEPAYMTLGVQFVVVVRDLVRQNDPQRSLPWRRKWAKAQEAGTSTDGLHRWITCASQPSGPGQVYHSLLANECASLGLTFRPWDGAHAFDLAEALDAGMPIAIWPHRCEHSKAQASSESANAAAEFKESLRRQLADRPLTDLPKIVLELRQEASPDPGRGMTLLWDDPTRRPRPDGFTFEAPAPLQPDAPSRGRTA